MSEYIFLIAQHGYGVGHLARISLLAEQLAREKSLQVFLFSCGGSIPGYQQPENIHFIQIPATEFIELTDINCIVSRPVKDNCTLEETEEKRSQLLLDYYNKLKPKAIIIEYFPFAPERFGQTLNKLLMATAQTQPKPILISSIRALPKDASTTTAIEVNQILKENFDHVFHHVDKIVFPITAYDNYIKTALDAIPLSQTGFVCKSENKTEKTRMIVKKSITGLLLTVGGGRDGYQFLSLWIDATKMLYDPILSPVTIVCGPLMPKHHIEKIKQQADADMIVYNFVSDLSSFIKTNHAIVSMGGYNSINEALNLDKPLLAFPRQDYQEQLFNVRQYANQGLIISGEDADNAEEIAQLMSQLIDFKPAFQPDCNGARESQRILQQLMSKRLKGLI